MATYDVIVVGARCAGSSTAMLLARQGLRVLVMDRASFPSDTLSTHQVQVAGVARLARWGLLDRVIASNAPPTRRVRFDQECIVLEGRFPPFQGVDALYSPRRTVLDAILVDGAREAGAEVRERAIVDELTVEDGRVTGIRGRTKSGAPFSETARLVVGADGKRSFVAKTVGAELYRQVPARTAAFYTYWEGVDLAGGEVYGRPGRAFGVWPTNDGLAMTYVASPIQGFARFREDPEASILATLDLGGDIGERVRAGRRVERIRGTIDVPNAVRTPFGPGWALVGDAGLVMDPCTGQGIADAFRDAELLSDAVVAGLGGSRNLDDALGGYQRARDDAVLPMFDFTLDIAKLEPAPVEARTLFGSLVGKQDEIDRFLGVLAGTVPVGQYLSPGNLLKVIGMRGMTKVMLAKLRGQRARAAA